MRTKPWLKDSSFRPLGDDSDEVSILVTELDSPGALGTWNPETWTLKIAPGQTREQQLVILIHELLHYVETCMIANGQMKRKVNHGFITNGAYGLAATLVHSGVIKGIKPEDWDDFWEKQNAAESA
jgi:hypothetical protein